MSVVTLRENQWAIGKGLPLAVIAGCNVLESLEESLAMGRELKTICADLGLPYVFKASFDKANRSSITSFRGPGLEKGLEMLAKIKAELGVPICTDVHEPQSSLGRCKDCRYHSSASFFVSSNGFGHGLWPKRPKKQAPSFM